MKKKKIKSLTLNKSSISVLQPSKIIGGGTATNPPPTNNTCATYCPCPSYVATCSCCDMCNTTGGEQQK